MSKLRLKDAGFAAAVDGGLCWEVLDKKIQEEALQALYVIQTALNAKNGLFLLAHEMQALAKLASIVSALAKAGQEVAWASAQERLKKTMPGFADDPNYLDLFRYVIDLGSDEGPFISGLKSFHCQFVDPKVRKIRLSVFGVMNQLPEEFPHLKIAGIKFMYACDQSQVHMGFCQSAPSKSTLKTMCNEAALRALMTMGEGILRFFHVKCAGAVESMNRGWLIRFYGNLDKELVGEMIAAKASAGAHKTAQARKNRMARVAERSYGRLSQSCTPLPGREWTVPAPEHSGPRTVADLQSKVIAFDDQGVPTTKQDTVDNDGPQEQFNWREFMATASITEQRLQDHVRAVIFSAICSMHVQMQAPGNLDALTIVRSSKSIQVKATRDLPAGSIMLPPLVKDARAIGFKATTSPWGLSIGVFRGEVQIQRATMCGAAALPKIAVSGSSEGSVAPVAHHDWEATHFPLPCWLVARASTHAESNCVLKTFASRQIMTFGSEKLDPLVDDMETRVPVMVNDKALKKDDELRVFWLAEGAQTRHTQGKKMSWIDGAEAAMKRRKSSAPSNEGSGKEVSGA